MTDINSVKQKIAELDEEFKTFESNYKRKKYDLRYQLIGLIREQCPNIVYAIHASGTPLDNWHGYSPNSLDICYYSTLEKAQAAMTHENSKSDYYSWTYSIMIRNTKSISDSYLVDIDHPPPVSYPYIGD